MKSHPLSLVLSENHSAATRLFCFPYAGGGASVFRQWQTYLPDYVQIFGVQPPGREARICEPPLDNVHDLVENLLPDLERYLDKPFAFFGHSTGALVAFECINALRRNNAPLPNRLIVSAGRAPHIPEPSPLHDLPEDAFIRELQRFSGTPEEVLKSPELMEIFIPILRADLAVEETYTFIPQRPLDLPISAIYGFGDKEAPLTAVAAWEAHTSGFFSIHGMEGGHFFIKSQMMRFLELLSGILSSLYPQKVSAMNYSA